jgi:hypothetical protein
MVTYVVGRVMYGGTNMSFWELLALTGTMATIFGVFLTIYGLINNRTIREESRSTREILSRIEQGQTEESRSIREILSRIEQGQTEARKEMAEAIKYLAQLIVSEGEKTREAIKASS